MDNSNYTPHLHTSKKYIILGFIAFQSEDIIEWGYQF